MRVLPGINFDGYNVSDFVECDKYQDTEEYTDYIHSAIRLRDPAVLLMLDTLSTCEDLYYSTYAELNYARALQDAVQHYQDNFVRIIEVNRETIEQETSKHFYSIG